MATVALTAPVRPTTDQAVIVQAVTVIMGTVVGLTYMFGFGNVLMLGSATRRPCLVSTPGRSCGRPVHPGSAVGYPAPRALHGATAAELRPTQRLLIFASLTTLALNVADPIITGAYGKATFDAVGPLLLIAWAEVGPGFLQAITTIGLSGANANHADVSQDCGEADVSAAEPLWRPAATVTPP